MNLLGRKEPGEASYKKGNTLFSDSKHSQSVPFFEKAAKKYFPPAFLRLGRIYRDGDMGIKKDSKRSTECFQFLIGKLPWFVKRAKSYKPDDLFNLALFLDYEILQAQDEKRAVRYYRLAANQGHAKSHLNLGTCYKYGTGVKKDPKKAAEHYKIAADKGDSHAQCNLATCYEEGFGVERNDGEATRYFKMSADNGDAYGQYQLAFRYQIGLDDMELDIDYKEAFRYFKMAADQSEHRAQFQLGLCYSRGEGVELNRQEAIKYFLLSAEEKYSWSHFKLGKMFFQDLDLKRSLKHFQLAEDCGGRGTHKRTSISAFQIQMKGYVAGSRSACYELTENFLTVLLNRNRSLVPELWTEILYLGLLNQIKTKRLE